LGEKWRRIGRFGLLGLIFLFAGCSKTLVNTTVHNNSHLMVGLTKPPMYDDFISIYKEEYIFGKNDCSNKSSKYTRILIENGYNAALLVLWHKKSDYNHVIVLVTDEEGKRHYYDPTNEFWGPTIFNYEHYVDNPVKGKDYGLWEILEEVRYEERENYKDGTVFLEYDPKGE
jgi:hypothetical protein